MMELLGFFVPSLEASKIFGAVVAGFGGGFFYVYRTCLTREVLRQHDRGHGRLDELNRP